MSVKFEILLLQKCLICIHCKVEIEEHVAPL